MKQFLIASSIFILFLGNLYSQENKIYPGSRIILSANSTQGAYFFIYNPHFIAKATYQDFSEITNEYPEKLLSSILSANNQQWYDYNVLESSGIREKKDKKFFDYVKSMDRQKTYMELICKFQFQYQGSDMAIVKFLFHMEEKDTICGAYVMQKVDGRWYKTATPFTNDLSMFLIRTKTDKIEQLITDNPGNDALVAEVLNKVKMQDGTISIYKLVEEFKSWYKNKDQTKISNFKDPKSW